MRVALESNWSRSCRSGIDDLGRGGLVGDRGRVREREESCCRRCRGREDLDLE